MTEPCPILGAKSYLYLGDETNWGEVSGTLYYCPVTSYGVKLAVEKRRAAVYCGTKQKRHAQAFRGQTAGQLVAPLYGWIPTGAGAGYPLARKLVDWGFESQELICPPSKSAEWAEGPDVANRRHLGLRVNQATLTGDASSGAINISLDLMGKTEEAFATATAAPNDQESLTEFDFADALFEIDLNNDASYAELQIAAFSWQLGRGLKSRFLSGTPSISGRVPSALNASGDLSESFSFTPDKTDDSWDDIARTLGSTEFAARLTLYGLHNGTGATGNYTKLVIAFPRLSWNDHADQGGFSELSTQINCDVLKPNTSSNAHVLTWSEVAAAVTTTTSTTTAGA
jgi:hypothetical protein